VFARRRLTTAWSDQAAFRRRIRQLWSSPKVGFFDLTQKSKHLIENALDVL
jgi:hypothetical protein